MEKPRLTELIKPYSHFCVGSLPFLEPTEAISFITSRPWILPFWPELPHRSPSEKLVSKARRALDPLWEGYRPNEVSGLFAMRDYLKKEKKKYPILKCQVAGPLTTLVHREEKSDRNAKKLLSQLEDSIDVCIKQTEWQLKTLREYANSFLIVLDEPEFQIWPKLDNLLRERLLEGLSYLYVRISEMGAFVGYHVCSSFFPDLLKIPCDLLSFDLSLEKFEDVFSNEHIGKWQDFLTRGLTVVPGVFLTEPKGSKQLAYEAGIELYRRSKAALLNILGGTENQLLLSAECGHANSPVEWLETIYQKAGNYGVDL